MLRGSIESVFNTSIMSLRTKTSDSDKARPLVERRRSFCLLGIILLAAASNAGCSQGVLDPRGPIGASEKTILLNSLGIMLAIVVPVIVATLGVAWWYRSSNLEADYRPTWVYSGKIEIVTWSIPAMVILLLGGVSWVGSHDLDPPKSITASGPPVEIEVVSLDWKWLFIYPKQGIASVNKLVVPAGSPLSFKLTSATVMNSFFVPQLGSQIYTMAGMTTRLNLLAERPGEFQGLSAQFSGDGFSGMRFVVSAVPRADFEAWVAATSATGPALDDAAYQILSKPSKYVQPSTYRSVIPDLFNSIVGMKASEPRWKNALREELKKPPFTTSGVDEICSAN